MNAPNRGDVVRTIEGMTNYLEVPVGIVGMVVSASGPHSTMNGGGFDVTITYDPNQSPEARAFDEAKQRRLRELQAKDPRFYTDGFIARNQGRLTVRVTHDHDLEVIA